MTVTVVSIKGPYPYASDVYNFIGLVPVSYTHLTLPTIYSV